MTGVQTCALPISGFNIFDFLDNVATNIMLPLGALLLCIYMGWFAPRGLLQDQMSCGGMYDFGKVNRTVAFIIRYIAPPLIAIVLISYFI